MPFFPVVFPILSRELNYRNHRKIIVVDGRVGFLGGLNIGDEYLGKNESLGFLARYPYQSLRGSGVFSSGYLLKRLVFLNQTGSRRRRSIPEIRSVWRIHHANCRQWT